MNPILRSGTDDADCWHAVFTNDEYRVPTFAPDDVVIDIGLKIGAFTAKAHERGSRRIYAFEACPENFAIARQNVGHLEGVSLYHIAVVGDRRPVTMSFPVGNDSFFIQEHQTIEVQTIQLVQIVHDIRAESVRYLKIDVEGSEWEILYSTPDDTYDRIREINGEYHQPSRTYWGLTQNPRYPPYGYQALQAHLQERGFFTQFAAPTPPPMAGAFHAVKR